MALQCRNLARVQALRSTTRVPVRHGGGAVISLSPENPVEPHELPADVKRVFYPKLGNRDIVGYGRNGQYTYLERTDLPYPGVRFKENTEDIMVLKEKEKGPWTALTVDEVKSIYRHSFRQTFEEMDASTGAWKFQAAMVMVAAGVALFMAGWLRAFVYQARPHTLSIEHREAMLERMVALGQGPIQGVSSKFDYEANDWKKNVKK